MSSHGCRNVSWNDGREICFHLAGVWGAAPSGVQVQSPWPGVRGWSPWNFLATQGPHNVSETNRKGVFAKAEQGRII